MKDSSRWTWFIYPELWLLSCTILFYFEISNISHVFRRNQTTNHYKMAQCPLICRLSTFLWKSSLPGFHRLPPWFPPRQDYIYIFLWWQQRTREGEAKRYRCSVDEVISFFCGPESRENSLLEYGLNRQQVTNVFSRGECLYEVTISRTERDRGGLHAKTVMDATTLR